VTLIRGKERTAQGGDSRRAKESASQTARQTGWLARRERDQTRWEKKKKIKKEGRTERETNDRSDRLK